MKIIPVTGLALFCALALRASAPPLSGLPEKADRGAAPSGAMLVDLDVPYVTNGHPRQKLDIFVQASEVKNQPLIIYIHGGAFKTGSKKDGVPGDYLSRGYAVASIDYRLSGDAVWPAQIEDCKAAVRWLRANAARYGIDPGRFAAWGASAGGHLAAMLGTTGGEKEFEVGENLDVSSRVQAVVDYFGPTDFLQMDAHRLPNGQFHDPADSPESALIGGPLQQNKDKAAKDSFTRALDLNPDSADAHVGLGQLCQKAGDRSAAVRHFRRALRLDPTKTEATEGLKRRQETRWILLTAPFLPSRRKASRWRRQST